MGGIVAALLLSGCSSGQTGMYEQYAQVIKQSFGMFSKGGVSRQQAAAIPYATIGYRIDDGDENILVLATDTGGNQIWTASNHIVFQTRDGRLIRTVGLPHNLGALTPRNGDAIPAPAAALTKPFTSARLADFPELGIYSLPLSCTARPIGAQPVTILGQSIATVRVDESCENREMGWHFVDSYWLDPQSGLAWQSIQHVAPKGEKIETEMLRPPG